ncbi:MAG: HEAT repeat domain-containing protein [Alphaproteobacteria bacterium]
MEVRERPPEWRYQRQFLYEEGVVTQARRPDLLRPVTPKLLDDDQVRQFLANGYLLLQPELPAEFHQDLYRRFDRIIGSDNDDNPGNNLLPLVPELQLVFDDPVVKGALTSVLGDGYLMHPHRVLHDNPPGSDAQVWHHDSYWGYKRKVHNHHPWWVMIMYYPQAIFEQIGPTGVIPGSQCIAQRLEDIEQLGRCAEGPAGTCMMIHYDIWHRKMKNFTDLKRFMVKFEFIRMQRPSGVTWDSAEDEWRDPARLPDYAMRPVWRAHWHWLGGRTLAPATGGAGTLDAALAGLDADNNHDRAQAVAAVAALGSAAAPATDRLVGLLGDDSEVVGLDAAYTLAALGEAAVGPLVAALRGDDGVNVDDARCFIDEGQKSELEMVARNAAHGLAAIGRPAQAALLDCAADGGPRVRKYACFALGELDSDDDAVIDALVAGCADAEPAVRLNAVEALGLKQGTDRAALALAAALSDDDDEVRFNAALALARLGPAGDPAVPALKQALTDGNRYTMGYAVEALDRIGTPAALAVLLPFLRLSRWCPLTTRENLF